MIIWTFAVITAKILVSMKYTSLFASNTEWIAKFPHRTGKSLNATNIKGSDPKERRFFNSVHECLYIDSVWTNKTNERDRCSTSSILLVEEISDGGLETACR